MVTSNSKGYFHDVEKSHRKYNAKLKRARSRQSVMNIYWQHKREHESLLRKHLRDEMVELNQIKKKFD